MPHPKKKQKKLNGDDAIISAEATAGDQLADKLSVDVLPNIFGFLRDAKEIMRQRGVCKKWKEAVKQTTVPSTELLMNGVEKYNAVNVMTRALPNLQQLIIYGLEYGHKFNDGEDPDEREAAITANWTSHDISILSNFSKLRILYITGTPLNGRYPFLFNSFPLLQKLGIQHCKNLKWDLDMLAGLPLLKELYCLDNCYVTGNISSLRLLKDTLERVRIPKCDNVEGNFMDLADFPHLKELYLEFTNVTGDVRDIGNNDFPSLELLTLPKGVYGGMGCKLQRISDAPDLMRTLYRLKQRRINTWSWYGRLSEDSPDWYESIINRICFVEAGCRIGYRWECEYGYFEGPCEVNWLDPEPDRDSSGYKKYIEELRRIESRVNFYRGFYQPPTEEEYNRLAEE